MNKILNLNKNSVSLVALIFSALAIGLSSYSILYSRPKLSQETIDMIKQEFKIIEKSNKDQILLAKHLTKIGAKLFGTDWCDFTKAQKVSFGKEGTLLLNYQDCGNPNNRECESIDSYPTWLINNEKIKGFTSLEDLKRISNYKEK